MNGICPGCEKPSYLIALHGEKDGPPRCWPAPPVSHPQGQVSVATIRLNRGLSAPSCRFCSAPKNNPEQLARGEITYSLRGLSAGRGAGVDRCPVRLVA